MNEQRERIEMAETSNELRDRVVKALRKVHDPEIPVNIYDLGLIYELDVSEAGQAKVKMTLTSPGCPVADMLVQQVRSTVQGVDGVEQAEVELVWEPQWTPDRMSEAACLELNIEPGQAPPHAGPSPININPPSR